ncbi:MAG: hypothetical protein OEY34_07675, partial [Cyclobacteriaceae bacterium]|nr:hypothetical protein [Cyclobacteriaceae bacterium]
QIYINGIKQETTFISENEVRYKVTGCDLTDNNIYVPELIRGGSSTTLDPINLLNKAPTILSVDKTFARPGELLTITFNNDININVLSSCNFYLDIDGIFVNNYTIIDNQTITIDVPEVYKNLNPEIILNWNGSSYNTGKLLNVVTPWTQYDLVPDAFNGNSLIHINHLSFVINDNFYFGAYKKYVSDSLFIYRYNIPQKSLSEEIFFGKIPPYPNDFKTDGNQMYYIHSDSLFSFNLSTKSHTFLSNIPVDQPSRNLRMDISNGKIAIGLGNSTSDFNMKNTKLFIYDIAGQFWEVKDGNFSNFPQDIFYINNELKAFGSNPVRVENYNSVSDTWNTEVIANPLFSAYYLLNHAVLNNKCYFSIENHDGSKTNYMRLAIYDNLNNSLKLLEQGPPNNDSITRPAILFTYNNELYYLTWSYEVGYYKTIYKFDDTKVP